MSSLRERTDDVPLLLTHFLKFFADENGVPAPTIEPGALRTLQSYGWPGNIRELRNFAENTVVLHRGGKVTEYELDPKFRSVVTSPLYTAGAPTAPEPAATTAPSAAGAQPEGAAPSLSVEANEKRLLREALIKARGNRTQAAQLMGISRRTLHRKLAQWPELDVLD
jgi:DNA-binding NtrC family response regulator